jgi:hypothetical protein
MPRRIPTPEALEHSANYAAGEADGGPLGPLRIISERYVWVPSGGASCAPAQDEAGLDE